MPNDQDRRIADVVSREEFRLRNFIRRRVADPRDVEDIVQDVFSELVEANRLLMPIDHITGWLFRVARNRIIDLFRRKKPERIDESESLLQSVDAGPADEYARTVLLEELEDALDELPKEQRDVFIAHEVDGETFKDMSARTGVSVNTLLSRKRYAVLHLRRRLQGVYDDLTNG
jgi:RNA polymerase sigma factor (sigma-70 family)